MGFNALEFVEDLERDADYIRKELSELKESNKIVTTQIKKLNNLFEMHFDKDFQEIC